MVERSTQTPAGRGGTAPRGRPSRVATGSHGIPATTRVPAAPSDLASMHGRIVDVLGSRIAAGELTGVIDPIQLSEEFEVSRPLVRECLRTLAAKGMVRARQRLGTVVTEPTEWSLLDEHVIRWRSSGPWRFTQMEESLQLRGRLEPLAARLTAASATTATLDSLTEATEAIERATRSQDVHLMVEADVAFHRLLYVGSGNDMLSRLAGTVHACLRLPDFQTYRHFINPHTAVQHRRLLDFVRAGDQTGAEGACQQLMELTNQVFRDAQVRALGAGG